MAEALASTEAIKRDQIAAMRERIDQLRDEANWLESILVELQGPQVEEEAPIGLTQPYAPPEPLDDFGVDQR